MAYNTRLSREATESIYNVHIGDTIRIIRMTDPYIPQGSYDGKEGVVEHIDGIGQLHGTWGGLAVIPTEDKFIIVKHKED